jgi:hypothetical protein
VGLDAQPGALKGRDPVETRPGTEGQETEASRPGGGSGGSRLLRNAKVGSSGNHGSLARRSVTEVYISCRGVFFMRGCFRIPVWVYEFLPSDAIWCGGATASGLCT